MEITEAKSVIAGLNEIFDSHDFIRAFIFKYPSTYGAMLTKHNNVITAHAEIANFLRLNSSELPIRRAEDVNHKSDDIFGNCVPCAKWAKMN